MTIDFSFKPKRHGNRRKSSQNLKANREAQYTNKRDHVSHDAGRMFTKCQRCEKHTVIKGHVLCKFCDEVIDAPSPR